jgi:hypothetical protein
MWKGTLRVEGQRTVKEENFGKPLAVKPNDSYDDRQRTEAEYNVSGLCLLAQVLLVPQDPVITESVLSE